MVLKWSKFHLFPNIFLKFGSYIFPKFSQCCQRQISQLVISGDLLMSSVKGLALVSQLTINVSVLKCPPLHYSNNSRQCVEETILQHFFFCFHFFLHFLLEFHLKNVKKQKSVFFSAFNIFNYLSYFMIFLYLILYIFEKK